MDRNTALTVGVAVLAVVALSLAAATLDSATVQEGGSGLGVGPAEQPGVGTGSDGDFGTQQEAAGGGMAVGFCYPWLADPLVVLGIVGAFLLMGAVAYYQTRTVLVPASLTLAFGIPVGLVWALLTSCRSAAGGGLFPAPSANGTGILPSGGGSSGLAEGASQTVSTPSAILAILLVVALAGSVLLLFVASGDEEESFDDPDDDGPDPDVAAVGRAAGDAADRIERDADVQNEVYRAWVEMTDSLDVDNPRSSTPAEFATAAVEAGMASDDVDELTRLFEEVRYGGEDVTSEREERAVSALRRIEETYADAE
ncbi:DUF4129 domain-containing protein [Salinirubrum litoreum]|uniref:DUF4129 domain-containing protein n=1 Tax=Salinirubrum litoreum TaxID=1126234 RepID=A0ABD5R9W6_9EURY